jgi:hypothetical protein
MQWLGTKQRLRLRGAAAVPHIVIRLKHYRISQMRRSGFAAVRLSRNLGATGSGGPCSDANGVARCFCCFSGELTAIEISFSAEILGRGRFQGTKEQRNPPLFCRCSRLFFVQKARVGKSRSFTAPQKAWIS